LALDFSVMLTIPMRVTFGSGGPNPKARHTLLGEIDHWVQYLKITLLGVDVVCRCECRLGVS
jgi:hypothetical protein